MRKHGDIVKGLPEPQDLIFEIRGHRVMLDSDLAGLYGVETFRLNEAVKRNIERFPDDFMFRLTAAEWANLTSQIAISSSHGGRRKLPYAFTEQGVAMLSSVLSSPRAVEVNIAIMRAFVAVRQLVGRDAPTLAEFNELRRMLLLYADSTDRRIGEIVEALDSLIGSPPPNRQIGFRPG